MFAITKYLDEYYLRNYIVNVAKEAKIDHKEINYRKLTVLKSHYISSFQKYNYNFYWINYNNVSDFEIGCHSDREQITTDNFNNIKINIFENSPLIFFENMTIVELNFIFAMYFAYYKLKDDKGKFYHGIIETRKNRVIFHTDEEILKYIPYSDYAMLAITNKSAYKICVTRDEEDCKICEESQLMLDSSKYNFCGNICNSKYILIPHNICTDICDESIFSINDNKCGLCKDFGDGNEYKFYNQSGCVKEKPENSIYVNEDLKIIDCDNNYKYENGKCILKCHDNCNNCTMYSTNINNQQCTSCKNGQLFLQDGNCVTKCSNKYFLVDNNCQKCNSSCETCNKASDNCTSCIIGKYLEKTTEIYKCKNCNDNCETCEFSGDNCLTCNQASSFKFFFNFSCYEICPNNTKLNKTNNICEEITNVKKVDEDNSNNISVMLLFFIVITVGLFSLLIFCLFKNYFLLNKKSSDNLLNEIDEDLRVK